MNSLSSDDFYQLNSDVEQVVDSLPRDLIDNLSDDELIDLQETIVRHGKGLDIRLNLPFLPKQLRLILLASLDPTMARIVNHLSNGLIENLTDDELEDLQELIIMHGKGLDVRSNLLFLPKQLHPILRTLLDQSCQATRSKRLCWTPKVASIAMTLGLMALSTGYALTNPIIQSKLTEDQKSASEVHPTILPWIESESACSGAKQRWINGFCYDSEHSPEF